MSLPEVLCHRSKIITKIRYNNNRSVINCNSVILDPVCTRETPAEFPKGGDGRPGPFLLQMNETKISEGDWVPTINV